MIFSSVRVDQLEDVKWALVALYVICTAGVIVGVYWEGSKFPVPKQHRGWRLLIASLAAEMLIGSLIFATDGWISLLQRTEIASLERLARGREISSQQAKSIFKALDGQKTSSFTVMAVPDVEAGRYALLIWELLRTAHVTADLKFLDKEPEPSIFLPIGTIARRDGTPESNRVVMALWEAGIVDVYWPTDAIPIPGGAIPAAQGPLFVPVNSIFVGKRVPPQATSIPK